MAFIEPNKPSRYRRLRTLVGLLLAAVSGCTAQPTNPSFPITVDDARKAVDEMRANPVRLQRPLVIIGGIYDPNFTPPIYRRWFKTVTQDGTFITVAVGFCSSFEEARRKVIDAIEEACPSTDPLWTTEVDVVGASLGGAVARYSAAPSLDSDQPRRLRIARLFSISSPQNGAELADRITITHLHRELKSTSPLMQRLARMDKSATYELYPYVRLSDEIVGERHAAPPGRNPIWVPNRRGTMSHAAALFDDRILADIARRLRDEQPLSHAPFAPVPRLN